MRSAVEAFKLANGLFVIPIMMAYAPLLLTGGNGWLDVFGAAGITLALVVTIAMSVERYLFTHMTKLMVLLSVTAAVLLVLPSTWSRACGLLVCLLVLALNYRAHRRSQSL